MESLAEDVGLGRERSMVPSTDWPYGRKGWGGGGEDLPGWDSAWRLEGRRMVRVRVE